MLACAYRFAVSLLSNILLCACSALHTCCCTQHSCIGARFLIILAPASLSPDSRPKSVDDVAMQDEVVSVLKKALDGHDVRSTLEYRHCILNTAFIASHHCVHDAFVPVVTLTNMSFLLLADAAPFVLWPTRNGQDLDNSGHQSPTLWVRYFCIMQ